MNLINEITNKINRIIVKSDLWFFDRERSNLIWDIFEIIKRNQKNEVFINEIKLKKNNWWLKSKIYTFTVNHIEYTIGRMLNVKWIWKELIEVIKWKDYNDKSIFIYEFTRPIAEEDVPEEIRNIGWVKVSIISR